VLDAGAPVPIVTWVITAATGGTTYSVKVINESEARVMLNSQVIALYAQTMSISRARKHRWSVSGRGPYSWNAVMSFVDNHAGSRNGNTTYGSRITSCSNNDVLTST
jgi:hypothetical protein